MSVAAYVFLRVAPGKSKQVKKAVDRIQGVECSCVCWGIPDVIAYVETRSLDSLQGLVLSHIQRIPGVLETDTHIVIE